MDRNRITYVMQWKSQSIPLRNQNKKWCESDSKRSKMHQNRTLTVLYKVLFFGIILYYLLFIIHVFFLLFIIYYTCFLFLFIILLFITVYYLLL